MKKLKDGGSGGKRGRPDQLVETIARLPENVRSRLALENSQPGAQPPPRAPVPRWGWGVAPPYTP